MTAFGAALDAAGDRRLVEGLMVERLRRGSGADRQRARWRRDAPHAFVQAVVELGTGAARLIPRQSGVTSSASPWG